MAKTQEIAISVRNIEKTFNLPHKNVKSIKGLFLNIFGGKRSYEKQSVLKDLSFDIKKGEFFGIVGRNGGGKSTLLKLISGIYAPDSGQIVVNGKLIPFIELGVGFNPELTGRENVYLNGALLGYSTSEMDAIYDEIVQFAELERFMDQKLNNYSSGMQVRLAFSIAIKADTDILVLDEVLAVGDEAFQRKCYEYFNKLKKEKKTVILVTHSMDSVQQFCTEAIMIEKGRIVASGNPAKVAQKYRELFLPSFADSHKKNISKVVEDSSQPVEFKANINYSEDQIKIETVIDPKIDINDSILSLFIDRDTGEQVYRFSTDENIGKAFNLQQYKKIKINITIQNIFPNGVFSLRASLKSRDRSKEYATKGDLDTFEVDRRHTGRSQWDIHWQPSESFEVSGHDDTKN